MVYSTTMTYVKVKELKVYGDDRGNLFEILRQDDAEFIKFGQVYFVEDRTPFTIRAFHRHFKMWDWFCITAGAAKFVFFDDPKHELQIVVADSKQPKLIAVPPKIWHGWMSLEPHTQLVSIASHEYNRDKPDEERCDPYILGDKIWQIQAK